MRKNVQVKLQQIPVNLKNKFNSKINFKVRIIDQGQIEIKFKVKFKIIGQIKYNRENQGQGKIYDQPPGQNKIQG